MLGYPSRGVRLQTNEPNSLNRGQRRRARREDAEMRWAMSGVEAENDDSKPVHPMSGGVQESAG